MSLLVFRTSNILFFIKTLGGNCKNILDDLSNLGQNSCELKGTITCDLDCLLFGEHLFDILITT